MSVVIDKIITIATSFIVNNEGKVLLLQRSNTSSYPTHWQFVEGKLEEGERIEDALKREIKEEIRCEVDNCTLHSSFHSQLFVKGRNHLATRIVFQVSLKEVDTRLSSKHIAFGWFTKKDALQQPLLPGVEEVIQKLL